jgi:multiple RNA-binding domain-containing protein 1
MADCKSNSWRGRRTIASLNPKPETRNPEREQMQKMAGSSHNWNMLFMRSDTVADAVAQRYSLTKGELLDHQGAQSMAVRMALGETHVIDQTKKLLRESGVNVAALEVDKKPEKRSKLALLVKNIPYVTEAGELRDLFARFGNLSRVVLPQTKTMAIVEFDEPSEARAAFRRIAYSKFKNQPIYLEWAPDDIFHDSAPRGVNGVGAGDEHHDATKPVAAKSRHLPAPDTDPSTQPAAAPNAKGRGAGGAGGGDGGKDADDGGPAVAGATLYVKNLNFATKEAALRRAMEQTACKVKAVKIMTKANAQDKAAPRLSMGFAFVEFASVKEAQAALRKLQGVEVDGHKLQVKMSSRVGAEGAADGVGGEADGRGAGGKGKGKRKGRDEDESQTRLVLRNVPFEATRKELRELLAAFGELTAVRLPKKFDGKHRGFAFADFVTHQEAAAAKEALQATHLYGRHLVIEWAEEEQSLEAVRRKTARYFSKLSGAGDGTAKRRRIEETLEGGGDDGDDNAFEDAFR